MESISKIDLSEKRKSIEIERTSALNVSSRMPEPWLHQLK